MDMATPPSLSSASPSIDLFASSFFLVPLGWVVRNVSVPPSIVFASGCPARRGGGGAPAVGCENALAAFDGCGSGVLPRVQPALVYFCFSRSHKRLARFCIKKGAV